MKYLALIGLLGMLLVLAVGAWLGARQPASWLPPAQQTDAAVGEGEIGNAASIAAELAQTRSLLANLQSIAAAAYAAHPESVLIAHVEPSLPDQSTEIADDFAADSIPRPKRVLSLLYLGNGFSRAVIDGKYVGAGDRLADGTRVLRITGSSVVLRGPAGRTVLHVPAARRVVLATN